ncbi:hypothetical protein [Microbulbifer thermotolerans]|uniref:Uncharacterized protein n=1 Tax=Microbulbifer thermotolerans TaxID=252514 RepID=A0A143HLX1_MICTH|nr:hypothetical protein [Microbulbifer thermotolerans]AMX02699.1 hypothetical protein A3224_08995 [Microbulbifer thermotolerans]
MESPRKPLISQRRIPTAQDGKQPQRRLLFSGKPRQSIPTELPFQIQDYLELVGWSDRCLREDKRGAIDEQLPPILDRLQIDPRHRLYLNRNFESHFKSLVGAAHSMRNVCEHLGKHCSQGIRDCVRCLSPPIAS